MESETEEAGGLMESVKHMEESGRGPGAGCVRLTLTSVFAE